MYSARIDSKWRREKASRWSRQVPVAFMADAKNRLATRASRRGKTNTSTLLFEGGDDVVSSLTVERGYRQRNNALRRPSLAEGCVNNEVEV
jgi:hypothetical protein